MSQTSNAISSRGSWPMPRLDGPAHTDVRHEQGSDEDLESFRLLVGSLFTSPGSIIVSNVVGVLVAYFCWTATQDWTFLDLTVVSGLTVLMRICTVLGYRASDHRGDTRAVIARWDREFLLGATAFSLCLGITCFLALTTSSVPTHIVTIICAIAYSSGNIARNAGRPAFVLIQLFCLCLPMAAGLFASSQPFYALIGVFIVFYVVTNIFITFSIHRNLLALASARKTSEALSGSLARQNVTLDSALNSMTHALAMFDADLRLEVCNTKFLQFYGVPRDCAQPGAPFHDLVAQMILAQIVAPDPADDLSALCRRVLELQEPGTYEIVTEAGRAFVISIEPTLDGGCLMLTEDATARKATAAQIERMAHFDSLTGLFNRFRFGQALKQAGTEAGSCKGRSHAILYIDLDDFKNINDTQGHEFGDQFLIQVARRLKNLARQEDVIARFGGDEFLVLAAGADAAAAHDFGQRVVDAMSAPFELDGKVIHATTSVGVALLPGHGTAPVDVLRAADIALYAAKAAGRNRVLMYDPAMAAELCARREIETDLREACETGRLFLLYQPIVDLATGAIKSCEALMRWKHPTKGIVPPSDFIPIAEETGLIAQMGEWAIRQACMDAVQWRADISVAVNVSAVQFKDCRRLIAAVKDALLISRLAPNRLELEVTESLLIENQDATLEAIRELRRIGVRFSLDDFGIGYSSLAYLARYPFSKVKIDRTFAQHVTTDGPSRSIIEVVCQLADRLGMRVVVEGVETESQKAEIQRIGAEQAQGYLFGRPQHVETLELGERHAA